MSVQIMVWATFQQSDTVSPLWGGLKTAFGLKVKRKVISFLDGHFTSPFLVTATVVTG